MSDSIILQKARQRAQTLLEDFLSQPNLTDDLLLAFGSSLDGKAVSLLKTWVVDNSKGFPQLKILPTNKINGANGAYSVATNTIYVAQEFLNQNSSNIAGVTSVILEEIGHALDWQLNLQDAPGDEGAIFASLVEGEELTAETLVELKAEDDTATILLDGEMLQVEQSTSNVTGIEQEMLELINRMRMNPAAELKLLVNSSNPDVNRAISFFNVNLKELTKQWSRLSPAPPLAWSSQLIRSARAHSRLMIKFDQQSHHLPNEPSLADRITNTGYRYSFAGENIFAFSRSAFHAHAGFTIDWGNTPTGIQNPPGHRDNIMESRFREVGIGVLPENNPATEVGPLVVTQHFGNRFNFGDPWLLGVVFHDADGDRFYDNQEGLAKVSVQISGKGKTVKTSTNTAGSYQAQVPSGSYLVTFKGGGLKKPLVKSVTVHANNAKLDAIAQNNDVFIAPPVYRFFNTVLGSHFYTSSEQERVFVLNNLPQYRNEGASFAAAPADPLTGSQPVYRFYNTSTGVHLYTISSKERDFITNNLPNYRFENVAYRAYNAPQPEAIPLYRFYNKQLDTHFYTPSAAERDNVLKTLPQYRQEGIGGVGFYVYPVDAIAAEAVI